MSSADTPTVHRAAVTSCQEKAEEVPQFRPGTNDRHVWDSVVARNEYFVPERFVTDDVVIDVGLHIGSFSSLVLARGAGKVYAYEADSENYRIACRHLQRFGSRIEMENRAVCRSDVPPDHLFFSGYGTFNGKVVNTGGGNVLWATEGMKVPTIAFDNVLDRASEQGRRRIRLLKLDCEGSEYPILFTSKNLEFIDEIVGEFHEIGCGADAEEVPLAARVREESALGGEMLGQFLQEHGFAVRLGGRAYIWGKFFAWNKHYLKRVFD